MGIDVSVIMPTFRRPRELAQALRSVLDQSGINLEVCVVDDSPDAEAKSVAASMLDSRVRYMRNPAPTGGRPAVVRNLAWPLASGRFIHFLDDDDLVPVGHYAAAVAELESRPEIGMVFGVVQPFGDNPVAVEREQIFFSRAARMARCCQRFGRRRSFAANLLFSDALLVCGAAIVRRECIVEINGFDADIELCEDSDFYGRIARVFGVFFTDRVTLQYRIGNSMMHGADVRHIVSDSYRVMRQKYRKRWGVLDLFAMKVFARTLLRTA